jgi:hypothetical protein
MKPTFFILFRVCCFFSIDFSRGAVSKRCCTHTYIFKNIFVLGLENLKCWKRGEGGMERSRMYANASQCLAGKLVVSLIHTTSKTGNSAEFASQKPG